MSRRRRLNQRHQGMGAAVPTTVWMGPLANLATGAVESVTSSGPAGELGDLIPDEVGGAAMQIGGGLLSSFLSPAAPAPVASIPSPSQVAQAQQGASLFGMPLWLVGLVGVLGIGAVVMLARK